MDQKYHDGAVRYPKTFYKLSVAAGLMIGLAGTVSGQTNLPPEILAKDATNYLHQEVVVRDVVVQVALRATVTLLNLNQKFPNSPLTCVIRSADTNKFPDPQSYLGQRVEVSGHVTEYQGRPQIILTNINQIKILKAAASRLQPPPAATEPAPQMAAAPSATQARTTAPPRFPVEANPDRAVWWVVGMLGVIIGLLGVIALWFGRRSLGNPEALTPPSALAQLTTNANTATELSPNQDWKQRALVAEAMAGRQGQILREKLMPELAEFAKQGLVQGLYAQRNALIETQQVAQKSLVELEARLAALQLTLPERIQAYEKRITELEKEVETQGEEMRELTRATLALVRKKLEAERARVSTPSRFN
jgi:hypothetical protein